MTAWVKKGRHGLPIPFQDMPSVSLLSALLKMRNHNSLAQVPLKDCCPEESLQNVAALRSLDGLDYNLQKSLNVLQRLQTADPSTFSGLNLDASRLGMGISCPRVISVTT